MFNENIYSVKDGIRESIRNNGIVVLESALRADFVEKLYRELTVSDAWSRELLVNNEGTDKEFRYSRDRIAMDSDNAPESLIALREFLRGEECSSFITYISGLACRWFNGSAAILQPGDSIGVHNDNINSLRTIGFNLYMNKDWQPGWGGEFILLNPRVEITPTFNKLSLFKVTKTSHHEVNEVSAQAINGRLAISGWFMWGRTPVTAE